MSCAFIFCRCLCFQSNASIDAAPVETAVVVPSEHQPDAPGTADQRIGCKIDY